MINLQGTPAEIQYKQENDNKTSVLILRDNVPEVLITVPKYANLNTVINIKDEEFRQVEKNTIVCKGYTDNYIFYIERYLFP